MKACVVEVRDCRTLEAEIANKLTALVLDHVRTFHALEGGLGVFVAECSGFLVIGFGGAGVLRPTAAGSRKFAHPLQCTGMTLRSGFFKQGARGNIILLSADAVGNQQAELILRLR